MAYPQPLPVEKPLRRIGTNVYDFAPVMTAYREHVLKKPWNTEYLLHLRETHRRYPELKEIVLRNVYLSSYLIDGIVGDVRPNGAFVKKWSPFQFKFFDLTGSDTDAEIQEGLKAIKLSQLTEAVRVAHNWYRIPAGVRQHLLPIQPVELVFVFNCPSGAKPRQRVSFFALPTGRQLVSNGNSTTNVQCFDYGEVLSGKLSDYGQMLSVFQFGISSYPDRKDEPPLSPASASDELQAFYARQKKRAEAGFPTVQYNLGLRYLKGDDVGKNEELGLRWIQAAATNTSKAFMLSPKLRKEIDETLRACFENASCNFNVIVQTRCFL